MRVLNISKKQATNILKGTVMIQNITAPSSFCRTVGRVNGKEKKTAQLFCPSCYPPSVPSIVAPYDVCMQSRTPPTYVEKKKKMKGEWKWQKKYEKKYGV
jgi:hypothetical protein